MARNKYPEETRNLIIETATRLFIENGYEHTSIQEIINHLGGLSKGAIYHHFKSKEDIMIAVADHIYSGSEEKMQRIRERKDLTGKEKLRLMFHESVYQPSQIEMFTAAPDMLKNPQLLVRYLAESIQDESVSYILPTVQEGIEDGSIVTDYPKELSETLLLLGGIWLNPMVYHCTPEEAVRKMRFFQHTLRLWGVDVIEDGMVEQLEKYVEMYRQNRKEE
ncbi:TetR/AcrR family transcriptional regulator [Qiania dongpingensis]|uniref:TetR/AcrR family transcriptional regulator n=1 Tax=Qiania dongpingensis TaxID=2763669 RepID=A0A7G9G2Y6_9FIRM|nr:TetR/AcrR family transcriptional regulator [Qiania dongpingensis]QNM05168.1 TetR/AcrR family transcriptional regulator [Qiania dongpingensis]